MSERWGGRSFVIAFYALVVAITGVLGAVLGAFGPGDLTSVTLLGLVELPPTPLGLAVYGVVTVGLALGVPLVLVAYVSRRADADEPSRDADERPRGDEERPGDAEQPAEDER